MTFECLFGCALVVRIISSRRRVNLKLSRSPLQGGQNSRVVKIPEIREISSVPGMNHLANERLHAAAKSGDVEQLQVMVRPGHTYRAVRPMLDQAAGLRLLQLWLGTGAELTHQDGHGTPLARVDHSSMRFAVSFCPAALAHGTRTGCISVESGP